MRWKNLWSPREPTPEYPSSWKTVAVQLRLLSWPWLIEKVRRLSQIASQEPGLKIHVYALCWNEERMLPYFFRHYDEIADHYFIFDNGSTDRSLEILHAHPKVTVGNFRVGGDSFVQAALDKYNEFWKQSRGAADWVIICNVDEHLYHADLRGYLKRCRARGATLIIPDGYEMCSDEFPEADKPLYQIVKQGMRLPAWDKLQIFNPNKLAEINFTPGRHTADPQGEVVIPERREVKLLHYKYLGLQYLIPRYAELKTGLRAKDIESGWGIQYLWEERKTVEEFERVRKAAGPVI
jgi:hypothetical protein